MEVVQEKRLIRLFRWLSKLFVITLSCMLLLASIMILTLLYLRSQPLPPAQIEETTTIYAADGQILDQVHQGQNRTYVPIEELPAHLLQAFLAVEDRHFYDHFGFDLKRIGGAVLTNIRHLSLAEGASTITQQLARNLYLNHDKTWQRKWKEAIYTIQLEMHYSKTDIFEQYLNQIYFGHSAYGVETAAQMFFGKKASELSLAESALLAGIPKGPAYYSPWLNLENALERQTLILNLMFEQGLITRPEFEQALNEEVHLLEQDQQVQTADMAPYFRDYIRRLATEEYGIEEEMFDHGGLHIYTTLDPDIQQKAEEAVANYLPEDRPLQGALLAIEPNTGQIKAMVGGRDYEQSAFNRVFAKRHPGSSIKPFLYYKALEEGFTPLTLMKSEPTTFTYDDGRSTYTPSNFNDKYANDYITLERAIAQSDNIYAVKTIMFLGEETFVDTLHRFGFEGPFQALPSLALGAQNVTLFDMVKGYSALANEGVQAKPIAVTRIEDKNGQVLVDENMEHQQLLEPDLTFILNQMLGSVFEPGGTGHRVASMLHRPVQGKTGSTKRDAWMLGFTPQLVAGVWVGYDEKQNINHTNDGRLAAQIWAEFMENALKDDPPSVYPIPDGVTGVYIDPDSGLLATEHCPDKRLLYFKAGTQPADYCQDHLPDPDMEPTPVTEDSPGEESSWSRWLKWWNDEWRD